jgi:lipoate---protein ligase
MAPSRAALVLGSTQSPAVADQLELARRGIDLVRRRSGGGAVLVDLAGMSWVDVIVPRDDVLWDDDVTRSFHWLGHAWKDALAACGVSGVVHEGGSHRTRWSSLACFAGVGAGEVLVEGRKVVGVSQRRTRTAARFQSIVVTGNAMPAGLVDLLVEPVDPQERGDLLSWLVDHTGSLDVEADAVVAALLAALPGGLRPTYP